MKKIPNWVKAIGAIVVFAALYGSARFLLYLDKAASGRHGLD